MPKKMISVRLPEEFLAKMDAMAKKHGITRTEIIQWSFDVWVLTRPEGFSVSPETVRVARASTDAVASTNVQRGKVTTGKTDVLPKILPRR